jgi:hypothetical protein
MEYQQIKGEWEDLTDETLLTQLNQLASEGWQMSASFQNPARTEICILVQKAVPVNTVPILKGRILPRQ